MYVLIETMAIVSLQTQPGKLWGFIIDLCDGSVFKVQNGHTEDKTMLVLLYVMAQ